MYYIDYSFVKQNSVEKTKPKIRELSFEDLEKLCDDSQKGSLAVIPESIQRIVGCLPDGTMVYTGRIGISSLSPAKYEEMGKPDSYELRPKEGFELLGRVN